MKLLVGLVFSLLIGGCTSKVVLSTHYPEERQYDLMFGWMLVDEVKQGSLTAKEREEKYKVILNRVLESDPNTKGCSVVENSFRYFEPGCCAAAKVFCQNIIEFEVSKGIFNSKGDPQHFYRVKNE